MWRCLIVNTERVGGQRTGSTRGADTDLVDRQLEWVAVERIPLYAEHLEIRRALFHFRADNKRNGRNESQRLEGNVNAIRSGIVPAYIEADVHVEAMPFQAEVVGHLDVNDGRQTR
jgi:hypothetical protein